MTAKCKEDFLHKHWITVLLVSMVVIFFAVFEVMDHSLKRDQELITLIEENKKTIKTLESQLKCEFP